MVAQRIQVLLKPEVLEVVKDLTEELDLTLSKTVSKLVEEALEARGTYSREQPRKRKTVDNTASINRTDTLHSSVLTGIDLPQDIRQTTVTKKTQPLEDNDLELLTKLKKLQALEAAGLL